MEADRIRWSVYCLTKYQPTLNKNKNKKRFVIRFRVSFPYLLRKDSQKTRIIPLQTDLQCHLRRANSSIWFDIAGTKRVITSFAHVSFQTLKGASWISVVECFHDWADDGFGHLNVTYPSIVPKKVSSLNFVIQARIIVAQSRGIFISCYWYSLLIITLGYTGRLRFSVTQ